MTWTTHEKKIAHRVFDAAVKAELAEIMADFKFRAASATTPADMWEIGHALGRLQRDFDEKYDFRYSRLAFVFGRLLREGRISEADLAGLGDDKMETILRLGSL
jgi:hypothetical protein